MILHLSTHNKENYWYLEGFLLLSHYVIFLLQHYFFYSYKRLIEDCRSENTVIEFKSEMEELE